MFFLLYLQFMVVCRMRNNSSVGRRDLESAVLAFIAPRHEPTREDPNWVIIVEGIKATTGVSLVPGKLYRETRGFATSPTVIPPGGGKPKEPDEAGTGGATEDAVGKEGE